MNAMKNQITPALLTGKSSDHLVPLPNPLSDKHCLQAEAVEAFLKLQQAAKSSGFNLQPASTFRDFERQKLIWNAKFNGERKVHDDHGCAIDLGCLDDWQKCQAILRWSAMPGASRHHWGTEIDIFDPDLLPEGQSLQLEPWEYQTGGYFQKLTNWLIANAETYGFFFPFMDREDKQIGIEPWHISYFPLAEHYERSFSPEILQNAWQNENVCGKECLIKNLDKVFEGFVL
jgi:LAS superfamily LD-carboxypeptidase LdcB